MSNSNSSYISRLIPVMLCFFAMGFVDLVGIASNYVKADLGLSDSQANIFPSLVFFWFLIFSVPQAVSQEHSSSGRCLRSLSLRSAWHACWLR